METTNKCAGSARPGRCNEWSIQAQYHGGYREGLVKGEDKTRLESIKNVMDGLNYSEQQAMELLKIPEKEQAKHSSMLKNPNSIE